MFTGPDAGFKETSLEPGGIHRSGFRIFESDPGDTVIRIQGRVAGMYITHWYSVKRTF